MEGILGVRRVAANILNKQSRTADKGWSSSSGVGRGLTTPHHTFFYCYEMFQKIQLAQNRVHWRACVNTVMKLRVP
jgi:hypothetical protein